MPIDAVYLAFFAAAFGAFRALPVRPALLLVCLGGWMLLPVGTYPPTEGATFPWWISGLALPSDMLVTKAWVAPVTALLWGVVFDPGALGRLRPAWADALMAAWCLWPLTGGLLAGKADPDPGVATLYVSGVWGAGWTIGRIWFRDPEERLLLLKGLGLSAAACLPIALVESTAPPSLYALVYEPHPFRLDGVERYVGYRPLGFFENGNQYGIWVCLGAVAAMWVAVVTAGTRGGAAFAGVAVIATALALAAQSVGAIALMMVGGVGLLAWNAPLTLPAFMGFAVLTGLAGALHLSGVVPLEWVARETPPGQWLLDTFRALGRGSFLWRIAQDIKVLDFFHASPLTGTAEWDWWRPAGSRPWGLAMLLAGQYGLVGVGLAFGTLAAVAFRTAVRRHGRPVWTTGGAALPLALIVVLALGDGVLNAFLYFPAMLAAGAIAGGTRPAVPPRAAHVHRA